MNSEELQQKKLEYRKAITAFKNVGKITECFHHDKAACKGEIKQSHSLQRNGRLSLIEGDVNGQKVIYTFTETIVDETSSHAGLRPIGKAIASTFFGFCDHHDTTLFSPIEVRPFTNTDEQCFLHSYRAFAHSYHRNKESLKAFKAESEFTKQMPAWLRNIHLNSKEVGVKEGEEAKKVLDELLDKKEYDSLDYLTCTFDECFPIACSSIIMPPFSIKGRPMNNHNDPNIPYSNVMLTILPDNDQTIIIFACFGDDRNGKMLLNELDKLKTLPLQMAISTLLITCAENTFFAPALWNAMGEKDQKILCKELQQAADFMHNETGFKYSKINFFDMKFSKRRLGI